MPEIILTDQEYRVFYREIIAPTFPDMELVVENLKTAPPTYKLIIKDKHLSHFRQMMGLTATLANQIRNKIPENPDKG